MVVKYKEKETFEMEDIIICILNALYKNKMDLVITSFFLQDVIDELAKITPPFIGEVTINSSAEQREQFISKCNYLKKENEKYILKEAINPYAVNPYTIVKLTRTIEENKKIILMMAIETVLLRKSRGIITYNEQILLSLYALLKNYEIREVNSFELHNYRDEIIKYFKTIKKKIFLEEYMKDMSSFEREYKRYISIETKSETIYTLRSSLELKDLYNLLSSIIPLIYIGTLTTDDITYDAFNKTRRLIKED